MKAIVFGGSGFLGSHVADALEAAGYQTTIYDSRRSVYLKPSQEMIVGDVLDSANVDRAVKGCSVVYNFAGVADIDEANNRPLESVQVNILGNSIILEAARKAGVKRFVFASSLYVYSKTGAFYRSTKQACELLIENYHEIFGLPYTILRYGSLYGPRAGEKNFIRTIIKQALIESKITRYGDGDEVREYIHVLDAAKGSVEILSEEFSNQCVIITGNQQLKVKDLLTMIREMLDNKITLEFLPPKESYHYEMTPYSFAPKAGKRLASRTYLDLSQGMLETMSDIYKEVNHPEKR
ncbi:MAG: NAD(P)-dependent oxidoreductase [Candidatus Omnitrophica bacterium]|nr:NAD(P)-dependent oxidoreductase [Candidatus Omnitrophota bacterium]